MRNHCSCLIASRRPLIPAFIRDYPPAMRERNDGRPPLRIHSKSGSSFLECNPHVVSFSCVFPIPARTIPSSFFSFTDSSSFLLLLLAWSCLTSHTRRVYETWVGISVRKALLRGRRRVRPMGDIRVSLWRPILIPVQNTVILSYAPSRPHKPQVVPVPPSPSRARAAAPLRHHV